MLNTFSKKFVIKFNNPNNPNDSMGRLVTFYNANNEPVAHLSLGWDCVMWFAYYNIDGQWWDERFPFTYNCLTKDSNEVEFDFVLINSVIFWKQNNTIQRKQLMCPIFFERAGLIEDFKESDLLQISHNEISSHESDVVIVEESEKKQIGVDFILVGYKGHNWLRLCLDTFLQTYREGNIKVNNVIYCDNNTGEDRKIAREIIEKFSKDSFGLLLNVIYLENDDNRYCENRLTAINKAIEYAQSDVVTILDSDIIFINAKWMLQYDCFRNIRGIQANAFLQGIGTNKRNRMGEILLPRILPCFFHVKREYLLEALRNDPFLLNDYYTEAKYGNSKIGLFGFHFSKIFLEMFDKDKDIMIMDYFKIMLPNRDYYRYDEMDGFVICDDSCLFHVENGSFEDVQDLGTIEKRVSDVLRSLKRYKSICDQDQHRIYLKGYENQTTEYSIKFIEEHMGHQ